MLVSACSTGGQASMLTPAPTAPTQVDGTDPMQGTVVTDTRLPDAISYGEVSLSETLETKHIVLVFYRPFW
jgi:hypothetical protein